MAANRNIPSELQVGQEDSAQAPSGPAHHPLQRPDAEARAAIAPALQLAQTQVTPSPRLPPTLNSLSRSWPAPRARSQAERMPRPQSESPPQSRRDLVKKSHRVLH